MNQISITKLDNLRRNADRACKALAKQLKEDADSVWAQAVESQIIPLEWTDSDAPELNGLGEAFWTAFSELNDYEQAMFRNAFAAA